MTRHRVATIHDDLRSVNVVVPAAIGSREYSLPCFSTVFGWQLATAEERVASGLLICLLRWEAAAHEL